MKLLKLSVEGLMLFKEKVEIDFFTEQNVMSDNSQNSIQPFLDEVNYLTQQKEKYQKQRDEQYDIVTSISEEIEDIITANVQAFSSIFAQYAGKFLGVPCELTYMKQVGDSNKRFYPIIDGKVRFYEEEMSESQRFFDKPTGIGIGKDGSVYVADWGNFRVRKLTIN